MSNHDREGSLSVEPRRRPGARVARGVGRTAVVAPRCRDHRRSTQGRRGRGEQPNAAPVRVRSRTWLRQWQPLAAAATVAGLAFVLVQMLPREHDFESSVQRTESLPAPVESQPRSSSVPAATDPSPSSSAAKALARPEQVVVPDRAPAPGAVPEPPRVPASPVTTDDQTAATADMASAGAAGADRREAISPAMAGRNASAAAVASSAREKDLGVAGPLDAAAWTAKIVSLHANGDVTAAADALRAFRTADPGADASLPDSLRDWARSVK